MNKDPVILEVAINGGVTPDRNPHVPLSTEAIIKEAIRTAGFIAPKSISFASHEGADAEVCQNIDAQEEEQQHPLKHLNRG